MKRFSLLILLALLTGGCVQQIALNSLTGIMETGFDVMNREQDLPLAEQSIAGNLKLLETVIAKDSGNTETLLLASIGYSSYALGFVEDGSPDRARMFYLRGKEYGLRILNRNEAFRNALGKGPDEFQRALRTLPREQIPALFWTAVGWASAINLSLTDPAAIADLRFVEAMMLSVSERDSVYFHSGANAILGVLYGSRPQILGGDSLRSRRYFESCLRINGGTFLMSYVLYAKSYAVQTQNRDLFERCLTTIDTTSIDALPEARLSNAIAKRKAQILRARIDELF